MNGPYQNTEQVVATPLALDVLAACERYPLHSEQPDPPVLLTELRTIRLTHLTDTCRAAGLDLGVVDLTALTALAEQNVEVVEPIRALIARAAATGGTAR